MKVSMEELRGAIRIIIAEELGRILPGLIAETLAERYIRDVVRSSVATGRRPSNLREVMQDDPPEEETVPRPLDNGDEGIYREDPVIRAKGVRSEGRRLSLSDVYGEDPSAALLDPRTKADPVSRVTGANPQLASLFEGTRPAPKESNVSLGETQQRFGEEGVPLDFLGKIGVDFGKVKQTVAGPAQPAASEPVDTDLLRQLERRREALNRQPVRG